MGICRRFAAPQPHGGDGRCGVTVLDFSQDSVEVTIERPYGLISHDLAAIKGHGRYQFLRDMPPSPPPHPAGSFWMPRRLRRHVRNPMISGVFTMLLGLALIWGSWVVGIWALLFLVVNHTYFILSEEPSLERRFGDNFRTYKANVPRWIPRSKPWEG